MAVSRRTFLKLAAAGLSSAALELSACVRGPETRDTTQYPRPEAPFTPPDRWYFVALNGAYEADARNYRLRVTGRVRERMTLRLDDLPGTFEEVVTPLTLACVGNGPSGGLLSAAWFRGVRTRDVLAAAGVDERATAVAVTGLDGYFMNRRLADFLHPDTLLAYAIGTSPEETVPLSVDRGFPVRVLTPGLYGFVQPKWLSAIQLIDESHITDVVHAASDFSAGRMQLASGFSWPRDAFSIAPGPVEILGWAFGDGRAIGRIEVAIDDGPWQPAEIAWNEPDDEWPHTVWTLWRSPWEASPGRHRLASRAFYVDGEGQVDGHNFPYSGGSLVGIFVDVREAGS